jgi:hypothetical protein
MLKLAFYPRFMHSWKLRTLDWLDCLVIVSL